MKIIKNNKNFSDKEAAIIKNQSRAALNVIDSILLQIKYIENSVKIKCKKHFKISARKFNNKIEISFFDNGSGIKNYQLQKIFEPFFSADKHGAGLGLAFCKLAIKNMGGSISCESEEQFYTRFIITLRDANQVKGEPKEKQVGEAIC